MSSKSAAKKKPENRSLRAGKPPVTAKSARLKSRPKDSKGAKDSVVSKASKTPKSSPPAASRTSAPAVKKPEPAKAAPAPKPAAKSPAPASSAPRVETPPLVGASKPAGMSPVAPARPAAGKPPPAVGKPPPAVPPKPAPRPAPSKQHPITRSFYWSELRFGDDLPQLTKPAIDRVQIARYAGAANDFNRLQLDEPFAHGLGFRGTFAPGALAMGFVGQLLTNWLKRGHVRRLSARFVKIIWPGDELTCHGRISELRKEKGACYADLELWAENQKGELVLRGQATCELYETPGAAPSAAGAPFSSERPSSGPAAERPPLRKK